MNPIARIFCWLLGHRWRHEAEMEYGRLIRNSTCRACGATRRTEVL